jgi:hypothetical protein
MPKLRDYFFSDLDTFLNPDEFSELHTLGSKEIMMIVEEDSYKGKSEQNQDFENATEGIYESTINLYMKASDYKKPSVGKRVTFDGEKYYVIGASHQDGILKISLIANES